MEYSVQNFNIVLAEHIKNSEPLKAENLIRDFSKIFKEELPETIRDAYFLMIFNNENGLISFMKNAMFKKIYKNSILEILKLFYLLLNNFYEKLKQNTLNIHQICLVVVCSSATSKERDNALDVLILLFEKGHFDLQSEEVINDFFKKLNNCFNSIKTSEIEKLSILFGMYAKKFPYLVSDNEQLRNLLISKLDMEMENINTGRNSIATGCLQGLSDFLESFPFKSETDAATINKLYRHMKIFADPVSNQHKANRAALLLLSKHISIFSELIYADVKWWHSILSKWLSSSLVDMKVGFAVLESFYKEMANILCINSKKPEDKKNLNFFIAYFNNTMNKTVKGYEIRLAIRGFGIFAKACKIHTSPVQMSRMLIAIGQKMSQLQTTKTENLELILEYIQTLSFILKQLENVSDHQIVLLEQVSILLIQKYPRLSEIHKYNIVADPLMHIIYNLFNSKKDLLESFLEVVVYQGVIWSCSHPVVLSSEIQENQDEKIVSYKSYLPLWTKLLKVINSMDFKEHQIQVEDRKSIYMQLLKELMRTLFVLIKKLDLNTKLKDTNISLTDPETTLEAVQVNDFVIFVNVVDFYQEILQNVEPELFKKYIPMYIDLVLKRSLKHPLVSGFYKLLSTCLQICDRLNYFNESSENDSLNKFLEETVWKVKQYKGDLQMACFTIFLSAPTFLIKPILPQIIPMFITLFTVGRSYLKLTELGLDALEKWNREIPGPDFDSFSKQVLPTLDSYLRSKLLDSGTESDGKIKLRKTNCALKRQRVLMETEPELFKIQKKILTFLGKLNNDVCLTFVNAGNKVESTVWSNSLHLKITLPYDDVKLDLYLDKLIPRVVELALYSSNRKIKVAACELLHAIVMLMLGKSIQMDSSTLKEFDVILVKIMEPLLKLGCDMDQVVKQLFCPLALQLAHWFSHPRQLSSSQTAIFIEATMDGVTNPIDSTLRDFSAKCIKEFIHWTMKQTKPSDLEKNPMNIKVIVRKIISFSLHPDPFKRLGAAMIFNNIYVDLRESLKMLSIFWLELLYAFVMNLALSEVNVKNVNCVEQADYALDHIQRCFVEKHELFNKNDGKRRIPPTFEGTSLKDVATWLLQHTTSLNFYCRQKCMQMFCKIAPLVTKCDNSLQKFINTHVSDDFEWISLMYEPEMAMETLLKQLQGFSRTLDGYIFVMDYELLPPNFKSKRSHLLDSLKYFMKISVDTFDKSPDLICSITKNVLKFTEIILLKKSQVLQYVTDDPESFWGNEFQTFLCNCIFNSKSFGFEFDSTLLKNILNLICSTPLDDNIINGIVKSLSTYIISTENFKINLNSNFVPQKQRELIAGLSLVQQTPFGIKLNLLSYRKRILDRIVNDLVENRDGNAHVVKLQHITHCHCKMKLNFVLQSAEDVTKLAEILCNETVVIFIESGNSIKLRQYFFETFKSPIIEFVLKFFGHFISYQNFNSEMRVTYLKEVVKFVEQNKTDVRTKNEIVDLILQNWNIYILYFDENALRKSMGLQFVKDVLALNQVNKLKGHDNIKEWILNLFIFEENGWTLQNSLDFKMQVSGLIPYITGHEDDEDINLSNKLKLIKETYFIKNDASLNTGIGLAFKQFCNILQTSKSRILLTFVADLFLLKNGKTNFQLGETMNSYMRQLNTESQFKSLKIIYNLCQNKSTYGLLQRYKLAKEMLAVLLWYCNYQAFAKFWVDIIRSTLETLEAKIQIPTDDSALDKIICYILIEVLIVRLKMESNDKNIVAIAQEAFPDKQNSVKKLYDSLLSCTFKMGSDLKNFPKTEISRLYHCHNYNALVAVISNTKTDIVCYNCLFHQEKNNFWGNLIDTEKEYVFENDFDELPAKRTVVVNILTDIHNYRKKQNEYSQTVKYIESQHLFNSTLVEDVSKFDFTHAIVRTQPLDDLNQDVNDGSTCPLIIQLEALDVNNHECMATVCGLIYHLLESDMHSPNEENLMPKWMKKLRLLLCSDEIHKNIKIFVVKVIENTKHLFKPYAKWFLNPIMKLILNDLGKSLNFFVVELVLMLISWVEVAIPTEDKQLASQLLKFLMENINNERQDIFKYNLDLIKGVVEAWKSCIEIPYGLLQAQLDMDIKSKKLIVGIQLTGIFLANKIMPWEEGNAKSFVESLCKILESGHRSVYQPCAETLGMALRCLHIEVLKNDIYQSLLKMKGNNDKFIYCLEGVAMYYPPIIDDFLGWMMLLVANVTGDFKVIVLKMTLLRIEIMQKTGTFSLLNFQNLLGDYNVEIQVVTLEILSKSLEIFSVEQLKLLLKLVSNFATHSYVSCRSVMYEIFSLAYNKFKNTDIAEICKDVLLLGLVDPDVEMQKKMYEFWTNEFVLSIGTSDHFLNLLDMYQPKIEQHFLGYSIYFLLNLLNKSDEFTTDLFPYPLKDCTFRDYELISHWRAQHASLIPLFTNSLKTDESGTASLIDPNVLLATPSSLQFRPTQSYSTISRVKSSNSSLLFTMDSIQEDVFKKPAAPSVQKDSFGARRFLRDKSKISKQFATFEIKMSLKREETRKNVAKFKERNVTIFRKYRIGDFPDIAISLSSLIIPLQMLSKYDNDIARNLYTALFGNLINKTQDKVHFIEQATISINHIFNTSNLYVPNVIGTFLDISLNHTSTFQLQPSLISSVSQCSGLLSIGCLILENYINSKEHFASPAKRSKGNEIDEDLEYWVRLAELYKEMNEWDVVSAIFLEKMKCDEVALKAIEADLEGNWRDARKFYQEACKVDQSIYRKDFYYDGCFKCLASLSDWGNLSTAVKSVVGGDSEEATFDLLWDDDCNQHKILPWYMMAKLNNIMETKSEKNSFLTNINKCLLDDYKTEFLKINYSQILSLLYILENDNSAAEYYLNIYFTNFLQNWSNLNPLFTKVRTSKLLNLQTVVDVHFFLKKINGITPINCDEVLKEILDYYEDTSGDVIHSIIFDEAKVLNRMSLLSKFNKESSILNYVNDVELDHLKKIKTKLRMDLILDSLELNNFHVALKHYKKLAMDASDPKNDFNKSLMCSKIIFLKGKQSKQADKLNLMLESWEKLAPSLTNASITNDLKFLISANSHIFDLNQEIYQLTLDFDEIKQKLQKLSYDHINNKEDIKKFGENNLRRAVDFCLTEFKNLMEGPDLKISKSVADAYIKLAHFARNYVDETAENFITCILRAINLGSTEGIQLLPCILNIKNLGSTYKEVFIKESKIPIWTFLEWIPQLLINLDTVNIFAVADVMVQIATDYPQAVIYAYRLSKNKFTFQSKEIGVFQKEIIKKLDALLLNDPSFDKLLQGLLSVSVPLNNLKHHITHLKSALFQSENDFKTAISNLKEELYLDTANSNNINSMHGDMFKSVTPFKKKIETLSKQKFNKVTLEELEEIRKSIQDASMKKKKSLFLKDYSPWLANFSANYLNLEIEIPGQYKGGTRPLLQHHVKISRFQSDIQVMDSVQEPIRITILGNDAKEYSFLVKYGEDLRQDQRIEQLFGLMNNILARDFNCAPRQLSISTFQVVPLTARLGIIQWLDDTKPFLELIKKLNPQCNFDEIANRYDKQISSNKGKPFKDLYGLACLKYSREETIAFYNSLSSDIPKNIFKNILLNMSINSESYFAIRHKFITSYAVMCISNWLLGIGDRHLSNFLLSMNNGETIGIDFGRSFGFGTQLLPVPELVPFRLTPHIINLMNPLDEHGLLQETMIHSLRAFRENYNILLATMSVFIQEPTLDWLEHVKKFESLGDSDELWYPVEKIEQARRKLCGANSVTIMLEELHAGVLRSTPYLNAYADVLRGDPKHNFRATKDSEELTVEEQVKCLINHASDPNLLGRMWRGWAPWI